MKFGNVLLAVGLLFIVIGFSLLVRFNTSNLPLSKTFIDASSPLWPKSIKIKSVSLEAEVARGGYKDQKWILDSDRALFLSTSYKLGEGGNTILYAHNTDKLFGNLKKTSIGDTIVLNDSNGKTYSFDIYSKEYIRANQMDKIATNLKDTITLFTCDGWFDEKRLVVKAKKSTKETTRLGLLRKL